MIQPLNSAVFSCIIILLKYYNSILLIFKDTLWIFNQMHCRFTDDYMWNRVNALFLVWIILSLILESSANEKMFMFNKILKKLPKQTN